MVVDVNDTDAHDFQSTLVLSCTTRPEVTIGHVQRGGSPTVRDRVVASEMGCKAVELLLEGKQNRIVCMQQHEIVDVDIEEGLAMKKELPQNLVDLAKKLTV